VARVLAVRDNLEASEHGGIGAEAVRYELELRGLQPLPSISTIERILRRISRGAIHASGTRPMRARSARVFASIPSFFTRPWV
jgi:hypothetical protein